MAQKREGQLVIRAMPWRNGLLTAGQQTTIEESALWDAENVTAELDGLLGKRPGLRQWGQTLKAPNPTSADLSFFESWETQSAWVTADASTGKVVVTQLRGSIRTTVAAGTSNESLTMSTSQAGTTAATEWSVRATLRMIDVPAYTAAATDPNTLVLRAAAGAGTGKEFAFHEGGIYYKLASDDAYVLIADTADVANGGWHTVEIRCDDDSGTTSVYLDEVLTGTVTSSLLKDVTLATGANAELRWEVIGSADGQYSTEVAALGYVDSVTDPFEASEVRAITDFRFLNGSGSTERALLAAAGGYIYHDTGLQGAWRVLLPTQHQATFFAAFRRTLLIVDSSTNIASVVWQWDGIEDPETLDDAPNIQFATEHKQRVWAAGDKANPLRAYFSGDRQPNLWFSPSPANIELQIDAIEQAGYLEIPSKKGDAIVAIFGDYYGSAIIFSRRGVWQVVGDGPASFALQAISQDVGAEGPDCVTQVGNDLWFLGRNGINSLATVQQFGDIASTTQSAPISDLWGQNPSSPTRIVRDYLNRSRLKYNPTQGLVYAAVPTTGQTIPNSVYVYNVNTKQWYGPWSIESRALENIEIAPPEIEVMAHGGSAGQVTFTDQGSRRDVTAAIPLRLESAMLNGRSLDPSLPAMVKTWKRLRLFVLPRGEWDVTISWSTDNDVSKTTTRSQNVFNVETIGNVEGDGTGEFRVGIDRIHSREEMGVIEVPLDCRGYSLRFVIEQDEAGEDLVIQGFEVAFTADGYEVD